MMLKFTEPLPEKFYICVLSIFIERKMSRRRVKGLETETAQDVQLNVIMALEYAGTVHKQQEVITRTSTMRHRYTYGNMYERVRKLANVLEGLEVRPGDVVGIMAGNFYRTVEAVYAIAGIGAAFFPLNWRLPFEHLVFTANHVSENANFNVLFIDDYLVPLAEKLIPKMKKPPTKYVIMAEEGKTVESKLEPLYYYEDLLKKASSKYEFPEVDERSVVMIFFTAGTTGLPKAIASWTQRAWYLHSIGMCAAHGFSPADNIFVVPPIFHGMWGIPFSASMVGAKITLPGNDWSPENLAKTMLEEHVTFTAGVPTFFFRVAEFLREREKRGERIDLSGVRIVFGGQSPPPILIETFEKWGATCLQVYGFSEAGPHVSFSIQNKLRPSEQKMSPDELLRYKVEVGGYPVCGMRIKVVDEKGNEVPHDGKTPGRIYFKAPWSAKGYWKMPDKTREALDKDGYLTVDDLVTIDENWNIRVVDRIKDVIKSGGEWIPSPLVEGLIMGHPDVLEACVVGVYHPQWIERPIAIVAPKPGRSIQKEDIINFLKEAAERGIIQKWWIPDEIIFVDEVPKTAMGKFDKKLLRDKYRDVLVKK
jgi:fatty-acyl-CoA synthase